MSLSDPESLVNASDTIKLDVVASGRFAGFGEGIAATIDTGWSICAGCQAGYQMVTIAAEPSPYRAVPVLSEGVLMPEAIADYRIRAFGVGFGVVCFTVGVFRCVVLFVAFSWDAVSAISRFGSRWRGVRMRLGCRRHR